jgi:hypothetical protein
MLKVKKDASGPEQVRLDTARYIDEAAAAGRPITVQIDDRPALVVEDERTYQMLWELVDRLETIEGIRRGLEEAARGEGIPFDEAIEQIRQKHKIPRD